MSVRVHVDYLGDLHCKAQHGPSGSAFMTDAPVDNQGKGEFFSPTDLVGTAAATCMLTMMGIAAQSREIDIEGASADVTKEMGAQPKRHISSLRISFELPSQLDFAQRKIMEAAAQSCPVAASLGSMTDLQLEFHYTG